MFNWLCTYLLTYTRLMNTCCIMYIKMFLIMFTVGGSSGLILGNNVIDISLHDSYYVVCHFHIVLSLGSILSLSRLQIKTEISKLVNVKKRLKSMRHKGQTLVDGRGAARIIKEIRKYLVSTI